MKKIYLLVWVVCTAITQLHAQETSNQLDDKGLRHGIWKGYHEGSKRLRYEGTFEHGKEKGIFKYYDDTKVASLIATRDFSKGDGSCYITFFDQKGFKVSEGLLVNKVYEGEWRYYHRESKELMTQEFYNSGKLSGWRKVFFKNTKLAEEVFYTEGKKNGLAKVYSEAGNLIEALTYKNDLLEGTATYYDGQGIKLYEGQYKKGVRVGMWKFYENDKVVKEVKARNFSKELIKFEEKRMKVIEKASKNIEKKE